MNNLQVAKVVYAAQSALDETQGAEQKPRWEDLNDEQRGQLAHDVNGHQSGIDKGVNADLVAKGIGSNDKLKYYIQNSIVEGFNRYEKALEEQTTASTTQPASIQAAMDKADAGMKEGNQESGEGQTHKAFEGSSTIPGHELEPAKANTTQSPSQDESK